MNNPDEKEIRYAVFIHETRQADILKRDVCDEFTRRIFDYLESEQVFDAHVFCFFLYHFLFSMDFYRFIRLMFEEKDISHGHSSMSFQDISLAVHKRLNSDYAEIESPMLRERFAKRDFEIYESWKDVKSEINRNAIFCVYEREPLDHHNINVALVLREPFTLTQKLDVLHFAICALNYLTQHKKEVNVYSNPKESIEKEYLYERDFEGFSKVLICVRDFIIQDTIKEGQHHLSSRRIATAMNDDLQIEKQWLEDNPPQSSNTVSRKLGNKTILLGRPKHFPTDDKGEIRKAILISYKRLSLQIEVTTKKTFAKNFIYDGKKYPMDIKTLNHYLKYCELDDLKTVEIEAERLGKKE